MGGGISEPEQKTVTLSPQSYHDLVSSSGGGINQFVLFHTALSRLPTHIQGGHGGVQHLQVPDSTQRI